MPQQSWRASDFDGLTPGIDPRRSTKYFVLAGKNYVFDSIGPKSAFGSQWLLGYPLGIPQHSQGFRLKLKDRETDRAVTMLGDGLYEWNESKGGWDVLSYFKTPVDITRQPHAWSQAYLNDKQYFCHPAVGIIVLDVTNNRCYFHPNPPCLYPIALCENNGRLCVMDADFFYWSGQSNGADWTPKLGGAGTQKISDRVSGRPIMITSYTGGVLVWTSGGVMRSEFTGDQAVYRHRALNTELRPVNSFCTCKIDDDTVLIVDERGLFTSKGDSPQPFSPLFNEFLIGYIQSNQLNIGQNIRVEWDELTRHLYVSVSFSAESPLYEACFVLYPPLDKWGQFSEPHYSILPIKIATGSRADDYYGFVGADGRVNIWDGSRSRQVVYTDDSLNAAYPTIQKPAYSDGGAQILSSSATANSLSVTEVSGVAGYFPWDGGVNAAAQVTGLDAYVRLGLLRFDLNDANDQMTEVTNLSLGSTIIGARDYAGLPITDPITVPVDNGVSDPNFFNADLLLIGSCDGVSAFMTQTPSLTMVQKGIRYYACSIVGIWHMLQVSATAIDQEFHLGAFELTGAYAGRFQ